MATQSPTRSGAGAEPRSRFELWRWGYLAPALLVYAVMVLYPLVEAFRFSFYDWDGISTATWVGMENYTDALTDPQIREALIHSLFFVACYAIVPVVLGLIFAAIFARVRVRGMTFFRAALFLPQILATVVVAVSWRWIFAEDGPLNSILRLVGLGDLARAWLGDFGTALASVGVIGSWVQYGLCMVLFVAGIQKISIDIYEAARVDGAGAVREFFSITLPQLRGEIAVALVFTLTFALRNFDIVWNTTSGGPGTSTTVPSYYIYQNAFVNRDIGSAAALGILLTVLVLVVTGVTLRVIRPREDA